MAEILLATCSYSPDGEPGAEHLDRALRERGIDFRWAQWDDATVDWAAADRVFIRSTWDYEERVPEFLGWVDRVGPGLVNTAAATHWNLDKCYLLDLESTGLRVVPTTSVETVDDLLATVEALGTAVVKPRTGAGGRGVRVVTGAQEQGADAGPWIVQPLVESVHTTGEVSVFVMDGVAVSRVDKHPAAGEIRVHEWYGGHSTVGALDPFTSELAVHAVAAAGEVLGEVPPYGRADLMWWDDQWVLSELELVEPGLYLDIVPGNAEPFAAMVAGLL